MEVKTNLHAGNKYNSRMKWQTLGPARLCSKVKEKDHYSHNVSHKPLKEKITVFYLESTVSFKVTVSLVWHKSLQYFDFQSAVFWHEDYEWKFHTAWQSLTRSDNANIWYSAWSLFWNFIMESVFPILPQMKDIQKPLLAIPGLLTSGNQAPCSCGMCAGHDPHLYKYWRPWDESQNNLAGAGD